MSAFSDVPDSGHSPAAGTSGFVSALSSPFRLPIKGFVRCPLSLLPCQQVGEKYSKSEFGVGTQRSLLA